MYHPLISENSKPNRSHNRVNFLKLSLCGLLAVTSLFIMNILLITQKYICIESFVEEQKRAASEVLNSWYMEQLSVTKQKIEQERGVEVLLGTSFFTRPPLITTKPVSFKSNNTTKMPYECSLQSQHQHQWALARIVLFQRNGGKQLSAFIRHYLHVLPADALVVIDHESDPESWTSSLLNHFAAQGIHVWKCAGSYEFSREYMWSKITSVYKDDSEFVFPVDVDELITVPVQGGNTEQDGLTWGRNTFYEALTDLKEKFSGKAFKFELAEPIPADCHFSASASFPSPVCELEHVNRRLAGSRWGCMDKCFARGRDFVKTDLGNHYLVTHRTVAKAPQMKHAGYNIIKMCTEDGIDDWYETSNLVLLHMQKLEFSDWVLHYLRGAAAHGFSVPGNNCSIAPSAIASHYCQGWHEFQQNYFSPDILRKIYTQRFCPPPNSPGLSSIKEVFAHSCRN
jgi:Glycosyl transferase family 2